MKIKKIAITSLVGLALTTLVLTGCSISSVNDESEESNRKTEVVIAAAASLKDVTEDIESAFEEKNKNIDLVFTYGGSGSLQQQIQQGSPTDVFISAGSKQMDALDNKGLLLAGTKKDLLTNKVVLITPKDKTDLASFKDLNSDKVLQIGFGEPSTVPVGQYTKEVLESIGILDSVKNSGKVVYAKDVKEVLTWVETGNVDAGIVYETDAKVSDDVNIVCEAPENSHDEIIYPVAIIKDTKNPEEAKKFVDFLSSDEGKTIFEEYGFTTK
ncbi:MAG: molybdate ABC transporter substrate-binding protein [Clostridium perfringens]|nr:molybdate ABC transporter substrate-binding protein [Clostridium perfringens]